MKKSKSDTVAVKMNTTMALCRRQFSIERLPVHFKSAMMVLRDLVEVKKQQLGFEIIDYPIGFFNDDRIACFLFDLDRFPLARVIERFESEGGSIKLRSEMPCVRCVGVLIKN